MSTRRDFVAKEIDISYIDLLSYADYIKLSGRGEDQGYAGQTAKQLSTLAQRLVTINRKFSSTLYIYLPSPLGHKINNSDRRDVIIRRN